MDEFTPAPPWRPRFPLEKYRTTAIFVATEKEFQSAFVPANAGPVMAEYAYPMRKAVTDYAGKLVDYVLLIAWIEQHVSAGSWKLYGAPQHLALMTNTYKSPEASPPRTSGSVLANFVNVLNGIYFAAGGLVWLTRRISLAPVTPEYPRLAADRVSTSDMYMFGQVIDDAHDLLIVDRNPALAAHFQDSSGRYGTCLKEDTKISLFSMIGLGGRLIRDITAIWRRTSHVDPNLFSRFAMLAAKRAMFAAFFNRYRPKYFWGRDDYSMDHTVRSQELRKIGGVALGINHGLPYDTHMPQWREIDFDIYYSFGSHLYDSVYKEFWPDNMIVKPVGAIHMKREYRDRLSNKRPKDIAFFPIAYGRFEESMGEAFKVAAHFKDRQLFIKLKSGRGSEFQRRYQDLMRDAPGNVVTYDDTDPYELLLNVSYSIAYTTLVAESLQFGVMTFNLDNDPDFRWQYYRNFEDLTVPDGATIIERIEAIEAGKETYDFDRYGDLIELHGPDVFDVIRQDIGLPPNYNPDKTLNT